MKKIVLNIPCSSTFGIYDESFGSWTARSPFFINNYVRRWTDWYADYLFYTSNPGIETVVCPYSRFIWYSDETEQVGTGIVRTSFTGRYRELNTVQKENIRRIWNEYIQNLADAIERETLLINCFTFPSDIGVKEDICVGYNNDWSCDDSILMLIKEEFQHSGYSVRVKAPNSNPITPVAAYGYKSVSIEVNKRVYLNEILLRLNPNIRQWMRWAGTLNRIFDRILGTGI